LEFDLVECLRIGGVGDCRWQPHHAAAQARA
jgi:hypothetical protein